MRKRRSEMTPRKYLKSRVFPERFTTTLGSNSMKNGLRKSSKNNTGKMWNDYAKRLQNVTKRHPKITKNQLKNMLETDTWNALKNTWKFMDFRGSWTRFGSILPAYYAFSVVSKKYRKCIKKHLKITLKSCKNPLQNQ